MRFKPVSTLIISPENKYVCEGASKTEARTRYVDLDNPNNTIHENKVIGFRVIGGERVSGEKSYNYIYNVSLLLSDYTTIGSYLLAPDLLPFLTSNPYETLEHNNCVWFKQDGVILMDNSILSFCYNQSEVDEHLNNIRKETESNMKQQDRKNRMSRNLTIGQVINLRSENSPAVFLGEYFGQTSKNVKQRGYNTSLTLKTTNMKKMYVFKYLRSNRYALLSNLNEVLPREENEFSELSLTEMETFNRVRQNAVNGFKELCFIYKGHSYYRDNEYYVELKNLHDLVTILCMQPTKQEYLEKEEWYLTLETELNDVGRITFPKESLDYLLECPTYRFKEGSFNRFLNLLENLN